MTSLIVIGGASLDMLHFRGRTERSAGGAGLYTALAARRAGARVTMVGPRPNPVPEELAAAAERIDWQGREVPPERLPSFEIAHLGGGRTELRSSAWRAEADLSVESLPPDLPPGPVFLIGLTDPRRQLELARYFKAQGRRIACGTYSGAVRDATDVVRQILAVADVFFCNSSEAIHIFGDLEAAQTAANKLLFVTLSANGVRVVQGRFASHIPAVETQELDPTGAGDTFCGTVLAYLERGVHPLLSARHGVVAAAEMVTEVGPAALLRPTPPPADPLLRSEGKDCAGSAGILPASSGGRGARVDEAAVRRIAGVISSLPEVSAFPFTGGYFPPIDHPETLDFFFTATLQQFGFWTAESGRYLEPYVAPIDGESLKGSDFLWAAYRRWLDEAPDELAPGEHRALSAATLGRRLCADRGEPMPALDLRLEMAVGYGQDLCELGWSPASIVAEANRAHRPLARFLGLLDHVGGYKEDPLRKKSALLALILRQRPEGFLRIGAGEEVPPVVDYHVQRSCLRMGLVEVTASALARRLLDRELVSGEEEWAVRAACYEAMAALQEASGRSMGAVDWFLFQNRRRCPEMVEPDCAVCPVDSTCAHRTTLFQPVHRTTFY